MKHLLTTMAVIWAAFAAAGCGSELSCAAGTVEKDGACVPKAKPLACGAGTVLVGGACVVQGGDAQGGDAQGDVTVSDATGGDTAASDTVQQDAALDAADDASSCVPFCVGKVCGDNGCGGSCGTCKDAAAPYCDKLVGTCSAVCVPDCVGRNCGADGCGGVCGECQTTLTCQEEFGRCVPDAWTCAPGDYGNSGLCDCGCGAVDPDCAKAGAVLKGCGVYDKCDAAGKCISKIPAAWLCAPGSYDANDACDCGCGAADPDCGYSDLKVQGCTGNAKCKADGSCEACVPACSGKECGGDGCGGQCGGCSDPAKAACDAGKCISTCLPTPLLCKYNQCGDDGCGGNCGTCPANHTCQVGKCVPLSAEPNPMSCVGNCGGSAIGGCYCTPACKEAGNCCNDFDTVCKCTPKCDGKQCGSDGCGGNCGNCPADKKFCDGNQQCTAACTPKCSGVACGDDSCGGTCGTCQSGSTCAWTQQCVPATWQCDPSYYADKGGCDCGCGASDPDCKAPGTGVYGCPAGVSCGANGTCDLKTCGANADCKNQWCTGKYFQGSSKFAGTCAVPTPEAKPPGYPCSFDLQCASGVCAAGFCRMYCKAESDCPPGQGCVGVMTENYGGAIGFAPVCQAIVGSLTSCKAQANCTVKAEQCVAYPDPASLQAKYLCTSLPSVAYGASCAVKACPLGHLCAIAKQSYQCTLPCPAGDSDCPANWSCGATTLHTNGTTDPLDDPKVPVCVPK